MIGLEDRRNMAQHIEQAHHEGARLAAACEFAGISVRTLQRWKAQDGLQTGDGRPTALRGTPGHALTPEERQRLLEVANEPRFADMPPARIVPALADEGVYLASESSFTRVLRQAGQNRHRSRAKAPRKVRPPTTHVATAPAQLWCWDLTYLPAQVLGRWFYLYLILDVFSRKIVGFEVHATDHADHAAHLVKRTALAEGIHAMAAKPVLHGDNGSTFKATTVLAMLHWLGIDPSYSRPRVSNDNPYVESLFRTAKYRPEFPAGGFVDLDHARGWAAEFVRWYNHAHRHSGIGYVTPAQRHAGTDRHILQARHELYLRARQSNPGRWSGETRNGSASAAASRGMDRSQDVYLLVRGDFAVDGFQCSCFDGCKGLAREISKHAVHRQKMLAPEQPQLCLLDEFIDRSGCRGQALQSLAKFSRDRIICRRDVGVIARPLLMLVKRGHALIDRLERRNSRLRHAQRCAQAAQERARHNCRSIQGTSCCTKEDQLERNTEPAVRAKPCSDGSDIGSADPK